MSGRNGCGGYTVYLIMKYPHSSCVCAFGQPHPYFLVSRRWVWLVGLSGIYGCGYPCKILRALSRSASINCAQACANAFMRILTSKDGI